MSQTEHKLFIANRGEIAMRILRAAKSLGISTVAACSEADKDSMAAREADEVQIIGPARADQSYLNIESLIQAAKACGATAIHPGYGFLAENSDFAEQVVQAGFKFVGPTAKSIRLMGDKSSARQAAAKAGVSVVPGSDGEVQTLADALRAAEIVGFPLLIKASAGGGGRGIRIAHHTGDLEREFPIAQGEAKAAFGSGALYLERFVSNARHVEVQILGDGQRVVHLYERECSLQRRRQKVFEEAPCAVLSDEQRIALCQSAVNLAQSIGYQGAGTLEYLFDESTGEFFFIEMNTRIQVEHPISEMVTGVDLVQWMIRIALGEPLSLTQEQIELKGAALEMRINAEDPKLNFFPSPGTISELCWPQGEGIRIESHIYAGYTIPPYYDSLLAKLIVHGENRSQAFERADEALQQLCLSGVATTIPLHQMLLHDPLIQSANFNTNTLEHWLSEHLDELKKEPEHESS
ncbi:MAG: Biotin carboxylase [Candidatus Celerinatantimonas neptuna]|nr:MAG: Biotin carboxylase [Candidatus Celerinatantimonas neptuna]